MLDVVINPIVNNKSCLYRVLFVLLSLRAIQYFQTGSRPEVKPQQMMGEDGQNGGEGTLAGEPHQQTSPFVTGPEKGKSSNKTH